MDLSLVHAEKIGTGTHPPDLIFPISLLSLSLVERHGTVVARARALAPGVGAQIWLRVEFRPEAGPDAG